MRSRRWCFTLNNYTVGEIERIEALLPDTCRYLLYGKEVAPDTGTPHLQGCLSLVNTKTLSALKKCMGTARIHLEIMRGSWKVNFVYCTKSGDFVERGVIPMDPSEKGLMEKERWRNAVDLAKEGKMEVLSEEHPQIFLCQYSSLKKIARDFSTSPAPLSSEYGEPTGDRNLWIWGPSGVGKTHYATHLEGSHYKKNLNKWWDHYQQQPNVIIDELGPSSAWMGNSLKIWGQEDPFIAEVKGGSENIRPARIIVTSQYSMDQIWGDDEKMLDALERRFYVLHFTEKRY